VYALHHAGGIRVDRTVVDGVTVRTIDDIIGIFFGALFLTAIIMVVVNAVCGGCIPLD
jgi:hypothetical protein